MRVPQKAVPAPCSTPTRSSDELSSRSSARAMPAETAPFTALRCAGRLMVTIRIPFWRRTWTSSGAADGPGRRRHIQLGPRRNQPETLIDVHLRVGRMIDDDQGYLIEVVGLP